MPSSESAMPPRAELANITPIAFIPVRITTPNSAGSLMPSIWVTVAEMPAVLTAALLVRKAIANHTAAFAKPYIAQTVISGLNPVVAMSDVSIMMNMWCIPVITAIG